jgi:hypothetical protein
MLEEKEINPNDYNIDDNDEESNLINVRKTPNEIIREYAMNTWYENIKEHTFPSFEIDIGVREVDSILSYNRKSFAINHHISDMEKDSLKNLELKIDEILQNIGGFGFVKLSTRSPKDSVFEKSHPLVEKILNENLTKIIEEKKDWKKITDNDLMIILTQACNTAMKISSGKEATALLCNSDRVSTDLRSAKDFHQADGSDFPKIIVRGWVDIPMEYEFRGFVCKKQLNALSQYFHYVFLPKLVEEKDQLQGRILEYFESVKHLITHENYVIDFGILVDGTIKIIEINPFHFSTGAPFFSWKKGSEERNILLNGPFTFRIRTEPMLDGRTRYMSACWDKFLLAKAPKVISNKQPIKTTTNNNNKTTTTTTTTTPNTNETKKDDCTLL